MLIVSLVAASLAALLHVYIFVMESLLWPTPRVRATFGITSDVQAEHTKGLAFNQGFYNLFLAVVTIVGVGLIVAGGVGGAGSAFEASPSGNALVVVGTGSMLAAALVLLLSDRTKTRAALTQGVLPLVALVTLLVSSY